MAGKPLDLMDIRQIITLKHSGKSNRSTAKLLGLDRKTVDKYVQLWTKQGLSYDSLLSLSEKELLDLQPTHSEKSSAKYEQLASRLDHYHQELKKPGCTLLTLWQLYKQQTPLGYSYSQFSHHYGQWAKKAKTSGKLTHKSGEKVFVDFAGKKLNYVDSFTGEVIEVEVFVGILPSSQYTFVQACKSQKRADFIEVMNSCLHYFEGVPQAIICDNLKSAVSKGSKYEAVVNKTFKDFASHYQTVVDPARPYHPQDKALVEGAVKLVYQRIYYPLSAITFFSIEQLNEAIKEELTKYNNYLFSQVKVSRKEQFIANEKPYLKALPPQPYDLKTYKRGKVQKMGHLYLSEDKHYYSVAHRYIGKHVEVQYNQTTVEIYFNYERIAVHKRDYRPGKYSTHKDHLASTHQFYNDWNPDFFDRKAQVIGPFTQDYISKLIAQYPYPEVGYKQAMGIIHLSGSYSKERVELACKRALAGDRCQYRIIESILKKGLDQLCIDFEDTPKISEHSNIRGPQQYK